MSTGLNQKQAGNLLGNNANQIFGNAGTPEQTVGDQMNEQQYMEATEQGPVQGLFDVAQPAQQATGLFAGLPEQYVPQMEVARNMVSSPDEGMQKQGYELVDKLIGTQVGGATDISFGAGRNIIVDENNDTFMATEVRDGNTGQTKMNYAPIGKTKGAAPVGKISIAAEYGETSQQMQERKADALKTQQQNKINIGNANEVMNSYITSQQQMTNYDEAISAIDSGANTSRLSQLFPTMRAATARLEQVGNKMALNILSGVSMGALSEKELEMLQATALPKMPAADLKIWLQDRKIAEQKYADLLLEASQAYAGGESKTDFATRKKKESEERNKKKRGKARLDELRAKYAK